MRCIDLISHRNIALRLRFACLETCFQRAELTFVKDELDQRSKHLSLTFRFALHNSPPGPPADTVSFMLDNDHRLGIGVTKFDGAFRNQRMSACAAFALPEYDSAFIMSLGWDLSEAHFAQVDRRLHCNRMARRTELAQYCRSWRDFRHK